MKTVTSKTLYCLHLALLVLLGACQHKPTIDTSSQSQAPVTVWQSDRSKFPLSENSQYDLPTWQYSAKVGITTIKGSEQANLIWRYHDQSNTVRLFGPLGVGSIKLEFDQYGVQLSDSKGILHRGDNAQTLLTDIIGWPLPIDALSYWLFAQPAPDEVFEYRLDADGAVAGISQSGWNISFDDYRRYSEQRLPRKISATKLFNVDQLGQVKVRLVTKNWQWPESATQYD